MTSRLDHGELDPEKALVASGHAFVVADARAEDWPIVWVNPAFEELTGYAAGDVVGHNCRILQGPDSDRQASARIRRALSVGAPVTETLLNYRPDGSTWWNQVTITPVFDDAGVVTHFVGVQSDVGARVRAAQERDDAFAAADRLRAQRWEDEHAAALALQRSLLPALPDIRGLSLAALYEPATDSAEVGGDWYDVIPLPDGSAGIAIGDVMGHDMQAAGAMGQLRSVLRSYAWEGHAPAEVLDRLNHLVCALDMTRLATCVYARLELATGDGPAQLWWADAGHPPPLLREPDGTVRALTDSKGTLIGIEPPQPVRRPRASAREVLPPGSTLLFYTDGLIENHTDQDLDAGIARLQAALAAAPADLALDDLARRLTAAIGHARRDDDQCLLLARIG